MFLMSRPQIERWLLKPAVSHLDRLQFLVGAGAHLLTLFSFWWLWNGGSLAHNITKILVVAWAVLPPVWFLWEYHLHRVAVLDDKDKVDAFSKRQEYAAKYWVAIAAALTLLLTQTRTP